MKNKYTTVEWLRRGILPNPLQVARDFKDVRARVQYAVEQSPKVVSFADAVQQVQAAQVARK